MKLEKIAERIVYNDQTFTKRLLFNEEKVLNFVLNFRPGQELPPHTHESSDLILHVLTGQGTLKVEGETYAVETGDVIHTKGEEMFQLINDGDEDLSVFVVLAPRPAPKIYADEIKEV